MTLSTTGVGKAARFLGLVRAHVRSKRKSAAMTQLTMGAAAPDFSLRATDGQTLSFADVAGEAGTVVAFICNHCPYVVAAGRRMAEDAKVLMGEGFGFVAINANDAARYPADSFERMGPFADSFGFGFAYLHDETQAVANAYGARVTPEFFGFDAAGKLGYLGRLDGAGTGRGDGGPRELVEALRALKAGLPVEGKPAMGCSVKWK
ncbi:MAG: thioredoxin family protein [Pseudomonadota bacterium]